jgi:hypothetical protein
MIFIITLYSILALEQPHVKNFLKEASKNEIFEYSFVKPVQCTSGKLKNSYVLAQNGRVFLKQVSSDGTIGSVCIK